MNADHTFPPLAALVLTPEQAAILHLLERVEALERERDGHGDTAPLFKSRRAP